ncbi:MAG: Zn-dependent oligopeptidase [Phycisphaerales bacterium]|nr:Zn-dependent oligopeptidase [Phycisphaerales bacterium]
MKNILLAIVVVAGSIGVAPKVHAAEAPTLVTATPSLTIDAAIAKANAAVAKIVAIPSAERTFDNTIGAIDDLLATFETDTSMLVFLSNVHPDAAVRDASQAAEEKWGNYLTDLGKREDLYKAVKDYAATRASEVAALTGEKKRLLEFILRDYKRAGMDLPADKRARLTEVQKEINRLGIEFNKTIAEDQTVVPLTKDELKGVSEALLKTLPQNHGVYLADLTYPTYNPIIESATLETTRQKMWMAYKRRGGTKNIQTLEKAIKLRAEEANLLGYANCADYLIETRMAKNYETVKKFYAELRPLVRKKAAADMAEFTAHKRAITGDANAALAPWDFTYIRNELMKSKYAVDGEKVQQYFPLEKIVEGLFGVTQSLYGLEYREVTSKAGTAERPLWHPDVKFYEVHDKSQAAANGGKAPKIGEFYLDLFPRPNKYGHAAQWSLVNHKVWSDGKVTQPLAALVCNFTKPTAEAPSLLTHEEVETFFHEFGHCLHTIVSTARYNRFSGTNTELDFVEAPSQMFENWVWDADVLATFAKHYKTGEPLPKALLDGMAAAKNLGSGIDTENQFYYGLTDLAFESTADGAVDTTAVANALYNQVTTYDFQPTGTFYQASFGHLMGYTAGYYSYMWSKVFASDMFVRFKELGMLNPEAGMYYRTKIISQGGTHDAMDLIKDYLGREPKLDSFLDQLGMKR